MEEEINSVGRKLLDQLNVRLAREKEIADILTKSVSEQEDYLKNVRITTQTQVLNLDKINENLNKQLIVQQSALAALQKQRAEFVGQQALLADQGDLFSRFNQDLSEIDNQIIKADKEILQTKTVIQGNQQQINEEIEKQYSLEQQLTAAKLKDVSEIKAAQQSTITRALDRGDTLGRAFATGTMLQKLGMFVDAVAVLSGAAVRLLDSSEVGRVPQMSRLTRRMNSSSLHSSEGLMRSLRSLALTKAST